MKKFFVALLLLGLVLFGTGCTAETEEESGINAEEVVEPGEADLVENYSFDQVVKIVFSGNSATVSNPVPGVTVTESGAYLVIASTTEEVEYRISGTTTDGSLKIYSDHIFKLVLEGVTITSSSGPAINIQSGKGTFIVLEENSVNRLTDSSSYLSSSEDMKGCLFSEGQLVFSGTGSLTVAGNYKHGICSDDYIIVREGTITVTTAVSDGIHTNDYVIIQEGTLAIAATGEGIECEYGNIAIHNGTLDITTSGRKGHGLKSAGNLAVNGGEIRIVTGGVASKGINSNSDVKLNGGTIVISTSGDAIYEDKDTSSAAGIKADGNLSVTSTQLTIHSSGSGGKGINTEGDITIESGTIQVVTTGKQYTYNRETSSAKGIKSKGDITINGGTIRVTASGDSGSEGIESKNILTINGGDIEVYAYDDALNASSAIVINGGTIYGYSSGNDGIDSNGTLTVTGGVVIASGTSSPEGGFDCDNNTFAITGGILIGTGGSTSTPTSNACTQRSVIYRGTGSSGQLINIRSSDGTNVLTYAIPRSYSSMTLLISAPGLEAGGDYVISSGGSVSGGTQYNGYYTGETYSGGTQLYTFTTSSMVTSVGSSSSGGHTPGGSGPGGRGN